ncbi:SigE family RNA polymerase sigma factor [Kineosporia sp. A_224]|uniref:SigE family RNA polymerase sigma factor n=1 Tax=Kineosporia sp. A_224 TaxID=1962180 RepID=UPI000B4BBF08|nr:SigE family RNA polymerase sigma factor [Kineosporia sp. A_224]
MVRLDSDVAEALDAYVRARGQRLLRTAYLLTGGDRLLAEDLVQNALASALVSWRRLRDVADMDAYMHTALVHARSRWWSRRWHGEVPSERLPDVATPNETDQVDGTADIVAALRELPPRQRAAVVLRYFEDLTEVQTAAVLGCSVGTVKSQTARGLDKLRVALGPGSGPVDPGDDPAPHHPPAPAASSRRRQ